MTLREEPLVVGEYNEALLRDGIHSHCCRRAADTVSVETAVPGYKAVVRLSMVVEAATFSGSTCHLGSTKEVSAD